MLNLLEKFFDTRSSAQVTAFGFALVAVAGIADYLTGFELSFSIFYLVPIVLVTWYAGKSVSVFICCVSALVWFGIEHAASHRYSSELVLIWNALVRLGFFLTTMLLVSKLRAFLDSQQTLAMTDALTGLWNVRAFKELSTKLVQLAARHDHPIVLGYIDLDDFKRINDNWGHSEGDRVLRVVADILRASGREADIIGRLGGDEFAVLLPETNYAGAKERFSRIHRRLTQATAGRDMPVTSSIGVAVLYGAPYGIDKMLEIADELMYAAKRSGKDRVVYEEIYNQAAETPPIRKPDAHR